MAQTSRQLDNVNILLGVTGGIAAYKSADLAGKLTGAGALVNCVLTKNACEFITPRTFQAVTGREELVGKRAVVKVALNPEGTVFFKGERWTAISNTGRVEPEETVIITKVDGLTLHVIKKQ